MVRTWNHRLLLRVLLGALAAALNGAAALSAESVAPPAQQRAEKLKAHVAQFVIRVTPNLSVVEKPFYSLTARVNAPQKQTGFDWHADLTREQAIRIIEHLAGDGFLAAAKEWDLRLNTPSRFKTEGYVISVDGLDGNTRLYEELGWNAAMLKRLDGLRKVLDGDTARGMDFLLERMNGLRRQWEAAAESSLPAGATPRADQTAGTVVGKVVFKEMGSPAVDVKIEGFPDDRTRRITTRTDADGMFRLVVPPSTNLQVQAYDDGYIWAGYATGVKVQAGQETNIGEVPMRRLPNIPTPHDPR